MNGFKKSKKKLKKIVSELNEKVKENNKKGVPNTLNFFLIEEAEKVLAKLEN